EPPRLTTDVLVALRDTATLPRPERLLDEVVLWIGKQSAHIGQAFQITYPAFRSVFGVWNVEGFNAVIDWMTSSAYFCGISPSTPLGPPIPTLYADCYLNPAGWMRYAELAESQAASRYGFMAMKYGDPELDVLIRDHFTPEVRKTEFNLRR